MSNNTEDKLAPGQCYKDALRARGKHATGAKAFLNNKCL